MNKNFTKKVNPLLLQIRNISALFFALFSSNIVYAQAPLYFDLEGLFQGIILWIATIIVSFSFKRKSISVPIAILWPFVFSIVGYQIEKLQHVWARAGAYFVWFLSIRCMTLKFPLENEFFWWLMQFGTPFLSKNHPKSKYAPALSSG